ncbi:MAG: T9SS type A sorting domain-containing protein [Saprospiraceae bacterium]|nr:T9SS type A sorting domain-containing protein [Saprospiraceae bacterium]
MKKHLTLIFALCLLSLAQTTNAQVGTWDDDFIFQILSPNSIATNYVAGDACSFGGTSGWGIDLTEEVEGELVWYRDAVGDSLACGPAGIDLTDKIVLIRRGTCSFSLKAYNAQQAGAKAVIIVNHYTTASDAACTLYNMTGLDSAALVTIPAIFIPRATGELITPVLDAGQPVFVKFALPRFYDAAGPYHYATPVSQVDSLVNMGVRFVNRTPATLENVELKAEITEPGGNVVTLTSVIPTVDPAASVFQYFPGYLPPAVLGEFNVEYTNSVYTESRDTLRRKFVHTEYTFATDNLVNDPGGVGTSNANFISGGFLHQEGAICVTGPNGGNATFVTFGISNIDSVYVPNVPPGGTANDINIFLYDGDIDEDGTIDLASSFDDLTQVGYGVYTMTGLEEDGVLIDAPIADLLTGQPVELKPNHVYYVSLYYNGLEAGYGRDMRFMNSPEEWFYLNFPSTPLGIGNGTAYTFFDGGWSGADVVQRLQLEGYSTSTSEKPNRLADDQVTITPNPAVDQVRVNIDLAEVSDQVTLTLFDARGREVARQTTSNFQQGQITMNVANQASGMYLLWVRTAEGSAMRKVAICH